MLFLHIKIVYLIPSHQINCDVATHELSKLVLFASERPFRAVCDLSLIIGMRQNEGALKLR